MNLNNNNKLITGVAQGNVPVELETDFDYGDMVDSVALSSGLPRLNVYQVEAIQKSLSQPFTLIWGPPGTGKTMTAACLASCFARLNMENCNGETTSYPKVLYCAPSNKAVNVVASKLSCGILLPTYFHIHIVLHFRIHEGHDGP